MENVDCLVLKTRSDRTKRGSMYTFFGLRSLEGEFEAQVWDSPQIVQDIQVGEVVRISGCEDVYEGVVRIKVSACEVVPDADPMQFVDKYPDEILSQHKESFWQIIASISDEKYRVLLEYLLTREFCESFYFVLPAASRFHHNKLGGLLVHSMETYYLAKAIVEAQPGERMRCNEQLIYSAALLHDIGKCWTYGFKNGVPIVKNEEYLYGHSAKSIELIGMAEVALGHDYTDMRHMLASHQGKPEYNSIVKPATKDAMILHMADYVGSRLYMFDDVEFGVDGKVWSNVMKQYVFKG